MNKKDAGKNCQPKIEGYKRRSSDLYDRKLRSISLNFEHEPCSIESDLYDGKLRSILKSKVGARTLV